MAPRRALVTVVSVWNDESVRAGCLDRSLSDGADVAPDIEYLPVDNRGQRHTTAGAALNEGVRAASHEVIAFVQQDIYLHDLAALERAAGLLMDDPTLGLLGSVGIGADGRLKGRIRDRVVLVGERAAQPVEVDSLDEVLFLARRADLVSSPLSEDADLAWHAYAVEWGLRQRAAGRRVAAVDIAMSHNSLSTNLARLDEAHAAVGRRHRDALPLQTTCGVISTELVDCVEERRAPFLAEHRWRWRWAKGSWALRRGLRAAGSDHGVLADLRRDIDRLQEAAGGGDVRIHNVTGPDALFEEPGQTTRLRRRSYDVHFTSGPIDEASRPSNAAGLALLTNLTEEDLASLRGTLARVEHVVGHHDDIGFWLASGAGIGAAAAIWSTPANRPARVLV